MLRLEGHILLWVMALVCALGTITALSQAPASMGSDRSSSSTPVPGSAPQQALAPDFPRRLADLPQDGRLLFEAAEVPQQEVSAALVEISAPLLRGVISDGITLRAVFASSADTTGTFTAKVSDLVAGYRVEAVEAGQVTLVGPDGRTEILKLRGSGELP